MATAKDLIKANEVALKGFPKTKLREAFDSMSIKATASDKEQEAKAKAAFTVCTLAHKFRATNSAATLDTVVKGWSDAMSALAMELAASGNRFAQIVKGKGDNPDHAVLTGYGNNVKSIAKGVIEFQLDPADCANEQGELGFREVRKQVEALRAEHRRTTKPDEAAFRDAVVSADEAWKLLREAVVGFKDTALVQQLELMLREQLADIEAQRTAQNTLQAEATAKPEGEAEAPEAEAEKIAA